MSVYIRPLHNVLLSFAQFEREVTGERIRDKIAAAKRKGLRMGGVPPLGYDIKDRMLVVNDKEAKIVQRIFEEMLTVVSQTQIARALSEEGITTKAWITKEGAVRPGARIDKKAIHKILRNRIYLGELSHKGHWYPGAHPAIIDHGLWGKVQEFLNQDAPQRSVKTKQPSRTDSLLRGLLYSPTGERMYPSYTRKQGKQYRYYISRSESRFGARSKTHERIPADGIEAAAISQIKTVLSSPEAIAAVCACVQHNNAPIDEATVVIAMQRLGDVWEQLFPAEKHRLINLMVERIDLVPGGLKFKWHELGWQALIGEFTEGTIGQELLEHESE